MNTLALITPDGSWHSQSLPGALANMAIFAIVGVLLLLICFKIFDKAITKIDLETEIGKGNVAAAILAGAILISISIILAMSMS